MITLISELSSKNINKMVKELADLECERSKMESTKEAIECQLKSSIKRTAKIEEVAKSYINVCIHKSLSLVVFLNFLNYKNFRPYNQSVTSLL